MSAKQLTRVPYLDAIRPDFGWHTEFAILASYSADLVVLTAALLALAGVDDDRGSGSKVDFANAVDQLAGKVRLLVQAGRLVSPARTPKILTILDRYVLEVGQDETHSSWHPKIALVKHVSESQQLRWRLWIGSRNLTRDLSWDVGLLLVGQPGKDGDDVEGISVLGETVARIASLPGVTPARLRAELDRASWAVPGGCRIRTIHLLEDGHSRGLPSPLGDLNQLTVISPFIDGGTIRQLGSWGGDRTKRRLVSSRSEMSKLAHQNGKPLAGFSDLLCMEGSAPGQLEPDLADSAEQPDADEEPEPRGLHAKMILAEHRGGAILWTGSVNATSRGWDGPNTEVVAELEVGPDVVAGINTFVEELATTVSIEDLGPAQEPDPIDQRLEAARKFVASRWHVVQTFQDELPVLTNDVDLNPPDLETALEVGLLAAPSTLWPRGSTTVNLPAVAQSDVTELVSCCVRLHGCSVSWMQRAPLNPPPGNERDRAALARYLDPRTFLSWIRSLLTGEQVDDAGGDWDQNEDHRRTIVSDGGGPTWWAPTIEDVLKAWNRDPESLRWIDKRVIQYLAMYREQKDLDQPAEELKIVDEFKRTWDVLRRELVGGGGD